MKRAITHISLITALIVTLICPLASHSEDFYPAKVKDISDRDYEPAVIDLLDNAKESIILSMYIIKPSKKGPIALLVNDLIEAMDRGVDVELYLNAKFRSKILDTSTEKKSLEVLRDKGAVIYRIDTNYRLHDKLIIIDSRYVVEGSTNWSVSALKSNFESDTLIDSPELARVKLQRLRTLPLESDKPGKIRRRYLAGEAADLPADGTIKIKKILLENENFFARMVRYRSDRSLDTYLLLLADSEMWAIARKEKAHDVTVPGEEAYFPVSLENIAGELEITSFGPWPTTAKRRQVIKTLRRLQDRYKLIDPVFAYGEDAWVTLKDLPGDTFPMNNSFFNSESLASKSPGVTYILLIKALLASEGKTLDSYTREELSDRFHIGVAALRRGLRELGE
ncbi:MAG: phospholipase D-like domain-containing protein [Candidatus Tantalella remota]|nr:phospholipase D-like domain-containing protein [Candidatus Tantalella remota]